MENITNSYWPSLIGKGVDLAIFKTPEGTGRKMWSKKHCIGVTIQAIPTPSAT
jgi:hypothetical protein